MLRELAPANGQDHTGGLSASTLYRFLRARGLTERQLLLDKAAAHKKYEAEFGRRAEPEDEAPDTETDEAEAEAKA